eukprot:TRINITY_DN5155_c0_g1_i6.p2 TRINITY_DN5155_c0_g1~~TRINITY_DN5155_c0_g1_i6.p2  ORF type:complete len:123 (+),score=7.95 TRINITY_DN5155_c0_g1_i6:597-965(+)
MISQESFEFAGKRKFVFSLTRLIKLRILDVIIAHVGDIAVEEETKLHVTQILYSESLQPSNLLVDLEEKIGKDRVLEIRSHHLLRNNFYVMVQHSKLALKHKMQKFGLGTLRQILSTKKRQT